MLLPPLLFAELAPHFDHHNTWHVARRKGQQVLRAKLHGECGPVLAGIDEPGSGCDFLKLHRRMMRHFMFVLEKVKDRNFRFDRWPTNRLPNWVERALIARFPAHDLSRSYSQIDELVAAGRIDDLGGFIEANDLWRPQPGASLHNRLHTALAAHECASHRRRDVTDERNRPLSRQHPLLDAS